MVARRVDSPVSMHHGTSMRNATIALIALVAAVGAVAQQAPLQPSATGNIGNTMMPGGGPNLPVGAIGDNDLLGITVYDAPPLSGAVRVNQDGDIRLPMVSQPIHAAGLTPHELENAIAAVLIKDHLLVNPIVTVRITEYDSRPITVVGAVKTPVTFQAMGPVTLLDAISRAGGVADNAGPEILISSQAQGPGGKEAALLQHVPISGLLDTTNPALNIELHGGDVVRVPQAGRVMVMGDVKKPGYFFIAGSSQSSIMKAVALSGGLGDHAGKVAYIYRRSGSAGGRNEIPVQLKKIMARKSPDVALEANDMLYIPDAHGHGLSANAMNAILMGGISLGTALLYIYQ